jgi:energy-coupling factor transporter ATP-binding protein EcfA2
MTFFEMRRGPRGVHLMLRGPSGMPRLRRASTFEWAHLGVDAWQLWEEVRQSSAWLGCCRKPVLEDPFCLRCALVFSLLLKVSVRHEDAATLEKLLQKVDSKEQAYIEVTGPKGVGKSTLVDNVLPHKAGVVVVQVAHGATMTALVDAAHRAIGGHRLIGSSDGDAKRVLFFFKLFGARPTVLFRVRERPLGKQFAEITPATRTLADEGFRILLDASNNSVDPDAKATGRELRLEMNPMSFDVVMRDPIFKAAFDRLKGVGLIQMVWQTLGGVATDLDSIASDLRFADDDSIKMAVASLVQHKLETAIESIRRCSLDVKTKLLPLFGTNDFVSMHILEKLSITLTALETGPDKVLRSVKSRDCLVPASPSMAFVLKHGFYQEGMFSGSEFQAVNVSHHNFAH